MSDVGTNFANAESKPLSFSSLVKELQELRLDSPEGILGSLENIAGALGGSEIVDIINNVKDLPQNVKDAVSNIGLQSLSEGLGGNSDFGLGELLAEANIAPDDQRFLSDSFNSFLGTVDQGIQDVFSSGLAFASSLGESALGLLSARLFLPEGIFVDLVKVLYNTLGSDPNYANGYLRKIALRKDLVSAIRWLDVINKTTYVETGKRRDSVTSSVNGAFNVAEYIMAKVKFDMDSQIASNSLSPEDILEYQSFFHSITKNIIVYSYGNLPVSRLKSIMSRFEISPSAFGETDSKFSGRHVIKPRPDLDAMAALTRVSDSLTRVVRTYITVRNGNIKKVYLLLNSTKYYGDDRMINREFHERMSFPIYSALQMAAQSGISTFANSSTGRLIQNIRDDIAAMIYELTKRVESSLFDPAKQNIVLGEERVHIPPLPPRPVPPSEDLPKNDDQGGAIINYEGDYTIDRFETEETGVEQDKVLIRKLLSILAHTRYSYYECIKIRTTSGSEIDYIFSKTPFPNSEPETKRLLKKIVAYDLIYKRSNYNEVTYDKGTVGVDNQVNSIFNKIIVVRGNIIGFPITLPDNNEDDDLYALDEADLKAFIRSKITFESDAPIPVAPTKSKLVRNSVAHRKEELYRSYPPGDYHIDDPVLVAQFNAEEIDVDLQNTVATIGGEQVTLDSENRIIYNNAFSRTPATRQ